MDGSSFGGCSAGAIPRLENPTDEPIDAGDGIGRSSRGPMRVQSQSFLRKDLGLPNQVCLFRLANLSTAPQVCAAAPARPDLGIPPAQRTGVRTVPPRAGRLQRFY